MWPAAVHRYKEYTSLSQGQAWSCALHQPMACEQIWHRPWSRSSSRMAAGWGTEKAMFEVATAAWVPWSKPQTNHSPNATGKKPMHWGPETSGCSSHLGLLIRHPWKRIILLQIEKILPELQSSGMWVEPERGKWHDKHTQYKTDSPG